jgi:hypothetical protein
MRREGLYRSPLDMPFSHAATLSFLLYVCACVVDVLYVCACVVDVLYVCACVIDVLYECGWNHPLPLYTAGRQTDRETDRETDRQADRQTWRGIQVHGVLGERKGKEKDNCLTEEERRRWLRGVASVEWWESGEVLLTKCECIFDGIIGHSRNMLLQYKECVSGWIQQRKHKWCMNSTITETAGA